MSWQPEKEPEVAAGQNGGRHGYRWRTVRSMSIGLKPVILKVKVPRWLNTTRGEEFEQFLLCRSLHENHACARAIDCRSGPIHDPGRYCRLAFLELGDGKNSGAKRPLENDYQRIGYRKVHAIAIDELYLGRTRKIHHAGHRSGKRLHHLGGPRPWQPGAAGVLASF